MAKFGPPLIPEEMHRAALESQGGINNKVINIFSRLPEKQEEKEDVDKDLQDVIEKNRANLARVRKERAEKNRRTLHEYRIKPRSK